SILPSTTTDQGTRHHGLVERVQRDRNRINSPHRRPIDKHGRTNSDSALHTSAMNPNPQDPFGMNQQMGRGPPQRNGKLHQSYPSPVLLVTGGQLFYSSKHTLFVPLWQVQSLSSRPKSCEVPGINIFPSPEQNAGLSHYQGMLNTGGSLPDLSNLHFPSPLPTPLDPEEVGYPNLSGGSSTGNLPAAMMHLGIGNSQGKVILTLSDSLYFHLFFHLQDQYSTLEHAMSSVAGGFDPSSNLYCSQSSLMGLGGSHGNLQDPLPMKPNMLYSNCGGVPNIILTGTVNDSNPSLSKDISSVLSAVPECFDSEGVFPLEDELRIEPLSLDGLSMLSDPDMVLPDPSVEDSFRSDRL
uniref:CREB regulated transcription coactivator 3 n=1 Tax=Astyanax mexicanus TaxID=7994 RepID=A0A8B9GVW8_ASTMX